MRILKSILIVALSVFIVSAGMSQEVESKRPRKSDRVKLTPEKRAERQTKKMSKRLELSDAQTAQLEAIQLEYAKEQELDKVARDEKRARHEARIRAILTDEQAKKFDEAKEDRKDRRMRKKDKRKAKRKEKKMNDEKLDERSGGQ